MYNDVISIIIPVYNSEDTIERCLNSLLKQTYEKIEIIIVNDGSTDDSEKICKRYSQEYDNVKLINQDNKGVSCARNNGIRNSIGEFIQFVDSDDYIDNNMCELLIKEIKKHNTDMVICGYKDVYLESIIENLCIEGTINNIEDIVNEFSELYKKCFFNSPCNKLFKKNKIKKMFDEKLSLGEDMIFNLDYMGSVGGISFITDAPYNYLHENVNSLTHKYRENSLEIIKYLYNYVNEFFDYHFGSKGNKNGIREVFINDLYGAMKRLSNSSNISLKNKIKILKEWTKDSIVINVFNSISTRDIRIIIFKFLILNKCTLLIYLYFYIKNKKGIYKIMNI